MTVIDISSFDFSGVGFLLTLRPEWTENLKPDVHRETWLQSEFNQREYREA